MIHVIFEILRALLGLVAVVLIVYVVISWLYAFDVVSRRNAFVSSVWEFTRRLSDPILLPFRRLIPPIAGVDLSTMIVLIVIFILRDNVSYWLEGVLLGGPVL